MMKSLARWFKINLAIVQTAIFSFIYGMAVELNKAAPFHYEEIGVGWHWLCIRSSWAYIFAALMVVIIAIRSETKLSGYMIATSALTFGAILRVNFLINAPSFWLGFVVWLYIISLQLGVWTKYINRPQRYQVEEMKDLSDAESEHSE